MISLDAIIADALQRYLAAQLQAQPNTRTFFRVSGFAQSSYAALLDTFARQGWRLGNTPLEVRSIEPISGHPGQVMASDRSATWYRNNLPAGHALILIQNRGSSDAQSLKDLFAVTELSLSKHGLPQLIAACVTRYQLSAPERDLLVAFTRKVARVLYEPQLRDLTAFLLAVDNTLGARPGTAVGRALIAALPHIGLFHCDELEPQLNTARGDKLLRQLRDAARVGSEVLDERARGDYLRRLEAAPLGNDDSLGGLSAERKRTLLRRFIEGQLRDNRDDLLELLGIDWREIQLVVTAKTRVNREEKLGRLADALVAVVAPEFVDDTIREVVADLRAGHEPDGDVVDRLLSEQSDGLARPLRNELRRLVKSRTRRHGDFLVGLAALAVELLHPLQGELQPGTRLQVSPRLDAASDKKQLSEALATFRTLYGGIEQALPSVHWQLEPLWSKLAARNASAAEAEDEEERERLVRVELPFRVLVSAPDGSELARAELIWQYRSDSPAAATTLTLAAEQSLLQMVPASPDNTPSLRVPVFNRCLDNDAIGDLDISRPLGSLGVWFEQPNDLRAMLVTQLQRRLRPQAAEPLYAALARLEHAWGALVSVAATSGLLAADVDGLLAAYETFLHTAVAQLRVSQEASVGFKLLNQAWLIGPPRFERWAVVPLLHPLKLLWWRERASFFERVVGQLLDPTQQVRIVDEPRYRRELAVTYGSSSFPPVLALPPGEGLPAERFLPAEEADGYELFLREHEGSESFGLDTDLLAEDEHAVASQRAVEGITAVVQDYIETYPFVRDGLEIVLFECRNSALPGLLVDHLSATSVRRGWQVRLSVIVHTSDQGAPLFQRVSEWVAAEQGTEERGKEFFPAVSLKVQQCGFRELLQSSEDSDIVILADVLAARGQSITSELGGASEDLPLAGYLPTYRAQQEPFRQGEIYRRLLLSQPQQPTLARLFLLAQHAAKTQRPVDAGGAVHFYRELTLGPWEPVLNELHDSFNWVICYDPTIDRFLMESTFPDKVQVIRYSLGLGAKRQHNLTVSSSHKAQAIVERRLATRLGRMLPRATPEILGQVAAQLVTQAKRVSGDIVLRAAGPGAFLNELIGLVAAKFETERRYQARNVEALTTWILLDDFEHWFGGGKFPDLLFVAISSGGDGTLRLHLEILEAKCVGQLSFETEATDAQEQVRRGVSRLAQAFAPGGEHLDALFWYDQLCRAVIGNLQVELEQQWLWELFREQLPSGAFELAVEGHSWAFCYDGQPEGLSKPDEQVFAKQADGAPAVPLRAHHYGRNELCRTLKDLIAVSGAVDAPASIWPTASDTLNLIQVNPTPFSADRSSEPGDAATESVETDTPATLVAPVAHEAESSTAEGGDEQRVAHGSAQRASPTLPAVTANSAAVQATEHPAPLSSEEHAWLATKAGELERALRRRGVQVLPIDPKQADVGPSIVRFKLRLGGNETIKKLQATALDLARDLSLSSTPFIDNVLGTNFVGVDLPRAKPEVVDLLPLLRGLGIPGPAELPTIIGKTADGRLHIEDLSAFPHLLVAGATGSGKSVFLRSVLLGLMTQYAPGGVELLIVDPKQTDFSFFDGLPYLRGGKVFTQAEEARDALLELVRSEMPRRQQLMRGRSLKIKEFNKRFPAEALPPIVALIDEYAQLLSIMAKKDADSFERDLMSLAAVARSTGIHLILATQRPSVNVVTGTLKANLPSRIAFQVPTNNDSRVVLDAPGAENLLGRGDMLFRRSSGELLRLQAPYLDEEAMQDYLRNLGQGNRE